MKLITRKKAKILNLKRYFTGKPCPKGHIAERTMGRHCLECKREAAKHRKKNPNYKYNPSLKQHLWNKLGSAKISKKKSSNALGLDFNKDQFFKWFDLNYKGCCHYCGVSLEKYQTYKLYEKFKVTGKTFGIDRKNSQISYKINNIAVACPICNTVKSFIFNEKEFKEIAKKYITKLYG